LVALSSLVPLLSSTVFAQRGAAALGDQIASIGATPRVLMIGAHPDDEDTQLITFLAKARHVETAYLALTRGDGGQNLIGNELGEALGMIRTEELLAARRIDGGHQYFTRAFDFGFTKTLDETLHRWPKDSILKDAVAIVRAYRPQIIIAVFTGTPADGHGQHQYSAVIAREVFDAAADSVRFPPSSVGGLRPWAPSKFYRLRRFGGAASTETFVTSAYSPLLGETYSQIAARSRSQHASQGQGEFFPASQRVLAGIALEVSRVSNVAAGERDIFDDVDTTWSRFRRLSLPLPARAAIESLAALEPALHAAPNASALLGYISAATTALASVTCSALVALPGSQACDAAHGDFALTLGAARRHAIDALLNVSGVIVEATAPRAYVAERDTMTVALTVANKGRAHVVLQSASLIGSPADSSDRRVVGVDSAVRRDLLYHGESRPTMAWWLRRPRRGDMFQQPLPEMVTGEDRLVESGVDAVIRIDGVPMPVRVGPIVYRYADPARGEVRRPIATVPAVSVLLEHEVEYARSTVPFDRTMLVSVHSALPTPQEVNVSLDLPAGLAADTAVRRVPLKPFGDANVYFRVRGKLFAGRHPIRAVAQVGGARYSLGFVPIEYSHIRPLRFYREATVQVEAVNATFANLKVGYIRGVGDNEMPMLEELGLPLVPLDPAALARTNLSGLTTIVLGPRAYEANPSLVANNTTLLDFVKRGGTLVVQYGQSPYASLGVLPFPFTLQRTGARVTDETAPVRVLDPRSPLLSTPNRITDADFGNWVQERTSYMPTAFDPHYRTVFSLNDPGEQPNDAAVLMAPLGRGAYVYTTFSFFRQLPAGNQGAARLFINLLSTTPAAANRPTVPPSAPIKP
jgi:LmbE family N-acetylglucosaminyl deacetylase